MTYTAQDAQAELLSTLTDVLSHDTDTFIELVEILTGEQYRQLTAENKLLEISRVLGTRNTARQSMVDRLQITAAMIDETDTTVG